MRIEESTVHKWVNPKTDQSYFFCCRSSLIANELSFINCSEIIVNKVATVIFYFRRSLKVYNVIVSLHMPKQNISLNEHF